jgi:hypothetical protein
MVHICHRLPSANYTRYLCNVTRHPGSGKRIILRQRIWGSVKALRVDRNTLVFLTETWLVADLEAWGLVCKDTFYLFVQKIETAISNNNIYLVLHNTSCKHTLKYGLFRQQKETWPERSQLPIEPTRPQQNWEVLGLHQWSDSHPPVCRSIIWYRFRFKGTAITTPVGIQY